jgi:hypothetical protein
MKRKPKYVFMSASQLIYPLKCGEYLGMTVTNQNYIHEEKQIVFRKCSLPFHSESFVLSIKIKI